jgi:MSHA biogenesis protein MshP
MIVSNRHKRNKTVQTTQQGSALMLALFIIIVLTLLGSALMKVLSTSSETIAQEVIGTRALMAAKSAMQAELQTLFPLSVVVGVAGTCNVTNSYNFSTAGKNIDGLYHCTATTSCSLYFTDAESINYYRLTSTGKCGSGTMAANSTAVVVSSRTIQMEARSL